MSNDRKAELKAEAKGLGIEVKGNPSIDTLTKKIDAYYESQAAGDLVQSIEDVEDKDTVVETVPAVLVKETKGKTKTKDQIFREMIGEAKKQAMKTSVVTISSNDKRDNDSMTVAYLGFENQYFGVSKLVPLDIPVQLEEALINIAKTTVVTLHKDEIKNGRRTGNKVPVRARKLSVSYEQQLEDN